MSKIYPLKYQNDISNIIGNLEAISVQISVVQHTVDDVVSQLHLADINNNLNNEIKYLKGIINMREEEEEEESTDRSTDRPNFDNPKDLKHGKKL